MIKNNTKNTVIAKKYVYCRTVLSKFRGLMFRKKTDKALIFIFSQEKIISIHMLFVFFPIDVLWLDKNKKVVQIKEHFNPFTLCKAKKAAKYLIELPVNTIKSSRTEIADTINFK